MGIRTAWAVLLIACQHVAAAGQEPVDYLHDIKPILAARCYACHGALKQEASLRLDTGKAILQGGDSGAAVVAGQSDKSLLIQALLGSGDVERMPLEGKPLDDALVARFKAWIDAGAASPADEPVPLDPAKHWAFQPPLRPAVPVVADPAWQANSIDAFIAVEHQAHGLHPVPVAARHVLLRRLYLDLIGLPPTSAELADFLADSSAGAYEKQVDRLLASPQYGERWARHWMDVWRYSDWDGYGAQVREGKPHIWRWRDWIIESLNADKPYDAMIQEMLAADELRPDDAAALRATGFLARNWNSFNRDTWLDNVVEHTGKAFLGLTFNCARCHDHKFDPIEQREYYALRAFFEPYDVRDDRVPGQTDVAQDSLVRVFDRWLDRPTYIYARGNEQQPDKEHPVSPALPRVLGPAPSVDPVALPRLAVFPDLRPFVLNDLVAKAQNEVQTAKSALGTAEHALTELQQLPSPPSIEQASTAGRSSETLWKKLAGEAQVSDSLSVGNAELWSVGAGAWDYQADRLRQLTPTADFSHTLLLKAHSTDFVAKVRVRILSGGYRSVGFGFDLVDPGDFTGAYLSAAEGHPKLQVFHRHTGRDVYSPDGEIAFPVELNRDYELLIAVRDQLLNVAIDGALQCVYWLPPRSASRQLSLWTLGAVAEFSSFELAALDRDAVLIEHPGTAIALSLPTAQDRVQQVALAQAQVAYAREGLVAAEAELIALHARIAADQEASAAQASSIPASADLKALALAAGRAERVAKHHRAVQTVLFSDQQLLAARAAPNDKQAEAEKKLQVLEAARPAVVKARDDAAAALSQDSDAYTRLGEIYPRTSSGRRRALAAAITDRQNPLAARVAINHIWLRHFGSPLVASMFDFGINGKASTHPALLDWLAVELMEQNWRMKPLHRLLVTSRAYRLQSFPDLASTANVAADPDNNYLWRANPHRVEAEVVRDAVLRIAGNLDLTMFGPDLDPNAAQQNYRRSIYFRSSKEKKVMFLNLFDGPNVVECYRRVETVVPQQALALANSGLILAQSRLLGRAISDSVGDEPTYESNLNFIATAFRKILCREPSEQESQLCLEFLKLQAARFSHPAELSRFTAGEACAVKPAELPHRRARENLVHTLFNHNDFITIR